MRRVNLSYIDTEEKLKEFGKPSIFPSGKRSQDATLLKSQFTHQNMNKISLLHYCALTQISRKTP